MSLSSNLKKILFISIWCILGGGLLVLLIAAIRVKKESNCSGFTIDIKGDAGELFVDKKDVEKILTGNGSFQLNGRSLKNFDLKKMEEQLEANPWVSDAELFFDKDGMLQVKVSERQPIARVFTYAGTSFYIDSSAKRLPLSDKFSARLPVFTGFPSDKEKLSAEDRKLVQQIKSMSQVILPNSFWMAQVAQVDINGAREFEIIPTIGNHVVEFGDGTDAEKKFRRLFLFYTQVISKTGFDAYERIKVQYAGQVVGVKKARALSRYDSVQAIKNVEKLILLAQTEQERLIKMDSIEMSRVQHRTDIDQSPAKTSDNLSLQPSAQPVITDTQTKHIQNPTLKSPPPYEPVKPKPKQKPKK